MHTQQGTWRLLDRLVYILYILSPYQSPATPPAAGVFYPHQSQVKLSPHPHRPLYAASLSRIMNVTIACAISSYPCHEKFLPNSFKFCLFNPFDQSMLVTSQSRQHHNLYTPQNWAILKALATNESGGERWYIVKNASGFSASFIINREIISLVSFE